MLLGDSCSKPWLLTCGGPRGYVLSPVLFKIYMKPLGEIIQNFGIWCHQYADDTQLYLSLPPKSEEATLPLDQCFASVVDWMMVNKLKLNPDKTEVFLVSQKVDQGIGMQLVLDGITLPLKNQVCSLGMLLD